MEVTGYIMKSSFREQIWGVTKYTRSGDTQVYGVYIYKTFEKHLKPVLLVSYHEMYLPNLTATSSKVRFFSAK